MISVHLHRRGFALVPVKKEDTGEVGRRLRARLGADRVFPIAGRFVVARACIAEVADEFRYEQTVWDEDARCAWLEEQRRLEAIAHVKTKVDAESYVERVARSDAGFEGSIKLDTHQAQAVEAISYPGIAGVALFDEQGTGKTISTLAAFDRLHDLGTVKRLLILSPKTVLSAWKEDAEKLFRGKYRMVVATGPAAQRRNGIRSDHDILVLTYEAAVRDRITLEARLSSEPGTYMLAVDESYFAKNPLTARSVALAALRPYCERAVVICGTPAPNSARDVVNQINISDQGLAFGDLRLPGDEGRARDLVQNRLKSAVVIRRLKEEVLPELPSKGFDRVLVQLQPIQRSIYEERRQVLIHEVRRTNQREFARRFPAFLAQRAELLQICSHPGVFDSDYAEIPAKLVALDCLVEDLVGRRGLKVVIWSFYRHSLSAIAARYSSFGLVRIDGSVPSAKAREEAIVRFQQDPAVRVFLGNPAAAGSGITLTASHDVIYESFSNQSAHYLQSLDRVHRRGQSHDVQYRLLVAADTVEERELDRLLAKERAQRELLGDKYDELRLRNVFLTDLGVQPE